MKLVLIVFMGIAWFSSIQADEKADELQLKKESEIQTAFLKLDARQTKEVVDENLQIVLAGEEFSLRILKNEIGNKTIAHSSFEGTSNVSIREEDHGIVVNKVGGFKRPAQSGVVR
jgi:hypothetical protein